MTISNDIGTSVKKMDYGNCCCDKLTNVSNNYLKENKLPS